MRDALKALREAAGYTQAELADKLQIGQAQVSAIEVGRRITTSAIVERWIELCGGTLSISHPALQVAAISSLTPSQHHLIELSRQLSSNDQDRLIALAEAMVYAQPLLGEVLRAQSDSLIQLSRKSSPSLEQSVQKNAR